MTLKPIVHEIRIQNQVIFLDPPMESARQIWLQQLHDWLGKSPTSNLVSLRLSPRKKNWGNSQFNCFPFWA